MTEESKALSLTDDAPKDTISLQQLITEGKNPRGIPSARFIENVEEFLGDVSVESAIGALNELYSKYKYMESSFEKSKMVYVSKLPEFEQTLEIIDLMKQRQQNGEAVITHYSLCDTLFAQAEVDTSNSKICLWIGASTMVEYSYDEALEMLQQQLEQTHLKISEVSEDLQHLKANSITVEVNMARLFNHNIKLKKLAADLANK